MDVEAIAKGLTARRWTSLTFSGWQITSELPFPEEALADPWDIADFLVADISMHEILLLDDGEMETTQEQAIAAVTNHLKGQQ